MSDLEVIIPSRGPGRPERLRYMLTEALRLSRAATEFTVCLDNDDDSGYEKVAWEGNFGSRVHWIRGPRMSLTGWTNLLANRMCPHRKALASFGDDHVVETEDWDGKFLAALDRMGGTGIVYGDDKLMGENLATAPVVSSDIVAALGWMLEPSLEHMCVDCVLMDIGRGAGCLAYVPEVITRHVHWCNNGAAMDATYAAAEAVKEADRARYAIWQRDRMEADIAKVRALIKRKAGADAAV